MTVVLAFGKGVREVKHMLPPGIGACKAKANVGSNVTNVFIRDTEFATASQYPVLMSEFAVSPSDRILQCAISRTARLRILVGEQDAPEVHT